MRNVSLQGMELLHSASIMFMQFLLRQYVDDRNIIGNDIGDSKHKEGEKCMYPKKK